MRKFADKKRTNRQRTKNTHFKNWVHSIPLWILSGYTRELANKKSLQYELVAREQYLKSLTFSPSLVIRQESDMNGLDDTSGESSTDTLKLLVLSLETIGMVIHSYLRASENSSWYFSEIFLALDNFWLFVLWLYHLY